MWIIRQDPDEISGLLFFSVVLCVCNIFYTSECMCHVTRTRHMHGLYMIVYSKKYYENRFATNSYRGTFAISPMVARVGGVLSILATAVLTSDALTF